MIYYVYRITNKILKKHYYGSRKCNANPKQDLGVKYFSSSKDKDFVKDQKENPERYKYKIIKAFDNREQALIMEIVLHNRFNVGKNPCFYNKAKQTATGFIGSGRIQSEEIKKKIGNGNRGKKLTEKHKQLISEYNKAGICGMLGKKHSEETKQKMSNIQKEIAETEESKLKRSKNMKGKTHTEKTKSIISQKLTGNTHTEETKLKMSKSKKGIKFTEEARKNMKIAQQKRSEESRIILLKANLGKKKDPESIRKRTETRRRNAELKNKNY